MRRCSSPGEAERLRVVANAAVGYDNIDVVTANAMGITVCNTPGVLDDTTADLAFLLILTATRLASDAERDLREGRWTGWGFGTHLARDVHGATLGLVGFGRIARAVAQRAEGFNMGVIHTTRHDTGVTGFVPTLDELLERSDIVEPACPAHRVDAPSHRRGGTRPHEADRRADQHGPWTGRGRRCPRRRPRVGLPLRRRTRCLRWRAKGESAVAHRARGQPCFLTSEVQQSGRARAWPASRAKACVMSWPGGRPPTQWFPSSNPPSNDLHTGQQTRSSTGVELIRLSSGGFSVREGDGGTDVRGFTVAPVDCDRRCPLASWGASRSSCRRAPPLSPDMEDDRRLHTAGQCRCGLLRAELRASSATCVAVGDDGGNVASVIVTQNGGTTWSDSTPPAGVTTLTTVSCPSSAVCYAGGGAGIMKSSNGGASWTIQDPSFPPSVHFVLHDR